jgi:DNA-binding NarL/FixJ family response regulator
VVGGKWWQIGRVTQPPRTTHASNGTGTRILIADDHESVRFGLRSLLSGEPEFEIVGEAHSVETTLSAIDALAPEIVVLDFALGADSGVRVLDALATRPDAPRVLMFSMEDERVVGQELTRRGADAYVMKQAPIAEILAHLHRIRSSLLLTKRDVAADTARSAAVDAVRLTKREREVLLLLKEGLASKVIARRLAISEKTVDVHKYRLRCKLQLNSDLDLARHAALFVVPGSGSLSES